MSINHFQFLPFFFITFFPVSSFLHALLPSFAVLFHSLQQEQGRGIPTVQFTAIIRRTSGVNFQLLLSNFKERSDKGTCINSFTNYQLPFKIFLGKKFCCYYYCCYSSGEGWILFILKQHMVRKLKRYIEQNLLPTYIPHLPSSQLQP